MALCDDILQGEGEEMEFKRELPRDATHYVNAAIAFSNGSGGRIIFGIGDGGEIVGLPPEDLRAIEESVNNSIADLCVPRIKPRFSKATEDGKVLLIVTIYSGDRKPYHLANTSKRKGTFIRIGSSNREATPFEIKDLESASRGTYHDESRYCDAELDEDAIAKLCSDLSIYGKRAFSRMDLVNKRVIRRDAGGEYPTLAYALLTGAPVPMSTIECARFRGVEKGEFTSMKSFGGPIYEQLEKAHEFVLDRLDNAVTVSERSISRTETYEIPDAAVREAIVNAVTHRNYAVNNARIYVSVFDDRVEVRSPGTVPVGMTLKSAMSGESAVRNRAIAEMFRSAGISEGWGNGIIRIRSLCMEQGLREPLFEERSSSFVVTLFRPARQGRGGAAGAREIHEGCRSAIVRYIAENGGATRREIGSLPGCAFSDLPEEKRYVKVSNIIRSLVRRGEIYNAGSDRRPRYVLPERGDGSPADAPRIR